MSYAKKILLVEGDTDKSFFNRLCQKLSLDTHVQVAPPKDVGGKFNTKQGVINHLEVFLPQLEDGQITNIGIVVDADYIEHGTGTEKTLESVSSIVKDFDYELKKYLPHEKKKGLYFKHSDGLADLGLWIMPDNTQEGMLEDWIKSCISANEQTLFENACSSVQQLKAPKFKNHPVMAFIRLLITNF